MDAPRVQYVKTADGVQIAYATFGEGTPVVMAANAWGDIEMFRSAVLSPPPRVWTEAGLQVVAYDGRNVGASDRGVADVSVDARVRDLEAVVDALRLDRFALFGAVHGSTVAVDYAARHPDRVSRMVLISAYARGADYYSGTPMLRAIKTLTEIAEENWEFFTLTLTHWLTGFSSTEVARRMAAIYRETMEARDYQRLIAACEEADVTEALGRVQAATLVVRSTSFQFSLYPEYTREVTSAIPGAQLVTVGDLTEMFPLVIEFVRGDQLAPSPAASTEPATFRAVLFTDLVGHTEMMSRLGDDRGREVLREHERITREVLAAHGGTEVKTMGDGFMASFGSVTRAVECGIALQRAFEEWNASERAQQAAPLRVRVGLNAGEPIEEEGPDGQRDLFGATVILASRIAAKAEGGEILVADTVRGLCSGKGFVFVDRGEFNAKGIAEPVRVYEVRWRE